MQWWHTHSVRLGGTWRAALYAIRRGIMSITDDLNRDGIAFAHYDDLFPDGMWPQLEKAAADFMASEDVRMKAEQYQDDPTRGTKERFLARILKEDRREPIMLWPDDIWLKAGINERLVGVADAYFRGNHPILSYYDLWYAIPIDETRERVKTQVWHWERVL